MDDDIKKKVKEIEGITQHPGFWSALPYVVFTNLHLSVSEVSTINWYEKLTIGEITFLIGLALKSPIDDIILTEEESRQVASKLNESFKELHNVYTKRMLAKFTPERVNQSFREFFGTGEMIEEPIFYGGSGAYDFQYLDLARISYKEDSEWLKENTGLTIDEMVELAKGIHLFLTVKINTREKEGESLRYALTISTKEFREEFRENLERFLQLFSCKPGDLNQNLNKPGDYNIAESHPIIEISKGEYFVPVSFNLARSIFESPFYWMMRDNQYSDIFTRHRGKANIDIAESLLQKTFSGKALILRDIKVVSKNATKREGRTITDIDLLFVAGNKAVVFQGKTKMLTEPARKGDIQVIKKDFSNAVQDAYNQGLLCREEILNRNNVLVDEHNKEIQLEEAINDVYLVCLTSNHYPAVIHQMEVLLNKPEDAPYPLSWSVFDLDLITEYLNDPFDFLYYLDCRIRLIDKIKADEEIVFLGYHINQKLPTNLKPSEQLVIINDFGQLVDANFLVLRGAMPPHPDFQKLYPKWKNESYNYLINQLKSSQIPQFTDAIFLMNDIAGKGADDLTEQIEISRQAAEKENKIKNFSLIFLSGTTGISYCCMSEKEGIDNLKNTTLMYADLNRYKNKANKWIAFGGFYDRKEISSVVFFRNDPWKYDAEKEEFSKEILGNQKVRRVGEKIGRNDPCPCNSGKKYKKCHGF